MIMWSYIMDTGQVRWSYNQAGLTIKGCERGITEVSRGLTITFKDKQ